MTKRHALSALTAKNLKAGKHADGEGLWLFKYDKSAGKWFIRLMICRYLVTRGTFSINSQHWD